MEAVPAVRKVRKLEDMVELVPVPGKENVYTIHFNTLPECAGEEMTEADWDKFEKDIEDAFEQIP